MKLNFTKMHGLGNDFVVIDAINQSVKLSKEHILFMADRHFGIGFDQLLLVEKPRQAETDFYYRIYNADASEVEQCGNGARCFARFVRQQGLSHANILQVGTANGVITLYHEKNNLVRVNMGEPQFNPANIPLLVDQQALQYTLDLTKQGIGLIQISALSMGNPHAIVTVDDIKTAPVKKWGKAIQQHSAFPQGVNVGFMSIESTNKINLRVYERGSGETLACGSGACAAVVAGIQLDNLIQQAKVTLAGGELWIQWDGLGSPVWMTGSADFVYTGTIKLMN